MKAVLPLGVVISFRCEGDEEEKARYEYRVARETEKAICLLEKKSRKNGTQDEVTYWVPKSAVFGTIPSQTGWLILEPWVLGKNPDLRAMKVAVPGEWTPEKETEFFARVAATPCPPECVCILKDWGLVYPVLQALKEEK